MKNQHNKPRSRKELYEALESQTPTCRDFWKGYLEYCDSDERYISLANQEMHRVISRLYEAVQILRECEDYYSRIHWTDHETQCRVHRNMIQHYAIDLNYYAESDE